MAGLDRFSALVETETGLSALVEMETGCQETSRRDTANKRSLDLCASIVLIF